MKWGEGKEDEKGKGERERRKGKEKEKGEGERNSIKGKVKR